MDSLNKIEYKVRDLTTRSVTLFPTRAQVSREIKDVPLKPGVNEITIVGLTPTVDENSIKVEGTGSAIITDIAVESLPNRDIFQEIYPDSDVDVSDVEEDEEEYEQPEKDNDALKAARNDMQTLEDSLAEAREEIQNAETRLELLDAYGRTLDCQHGVVIDESLGSYKKQRQLAFKDQMAGQRRERQVIESTYEVSLRIARLAREQDRERARDRRGKVRADRAKAKERLRLARREEDRIKEKERVKRERQSFWPKYVYSVRVTLEANAYTPMSSRRGSVSSDVDLAKASPSLQSATDTNLAPGTCDLLLSYVTVSAYWSPSYDLQLSTTSSTAALLFDAQLHNHTSEAWEGCKITLSTSQASFSGLEDTIPILMPWHIKIGNKAFRSGDQSAAILHSREEESHREAYRNKTGPSNTLKPRSQMFGVVAEASASQVDYQAQLMLLEQQNQRRLMMARQEAMPQNPYAQNPYAQQQMQPQVQQQMQAQRPSLFALPPGSEVVNQIDRASQGPPQQVPAGGLFGSSNVQQQSSGGLFGGGSLFGSAGPARPTPQNIQQIQQQLQPQIQQMQQRGERLDALAPVPPPPAAPVLSVPAAPARNMRARMDLFGGDGEGDMDIHMNDDDTMAAEPQPALDFQESLVEETGFTTTYDLPGYRTLVPKSTSSKQRVARVSFTNVFFSHTVVAKYKPVAYLKAKLRNGSKLTLLRGPTGLTLDGSFMGRTTLPRCSAGDVFSLSLGVDPAIKVIYPKPDVRRATSGLFTKEDSSVYHRSVTLENTRAAAGKPVNVLVLDQVPVSEDERLRVELLAPRGMTVGSAGVPTGQPARESKDQKDWGRSTAVLKKGGEVSWDVVLNAGKAVKLALEYSVTMPSGDHALQC